MGSTIIRNARFQLISACAQITRADGSSCYS
ncbi:MAG: hypothetical protein BECKG1743D_GA0114223_103993 [Candidatus Kentron sp. G]|nr:MAG: hypothetical protein BECKG1743F_GA0114225_105712 [Candidatus Kentron sp. G]VFN02799.1 MAG: hypothetical protein BECKG1743D_GA0114223_103993 [Candidatus Kentron sp. G]VFN03374.1 MAG: hypothetical protein BECKG1743E_GA0114224_106091 [Candidatus Kentron sp. G]